MESEMLRGFRIKWVSEKKEGMREMRGGRGWDRDGQV